MSCFDAERLNASGAPPQGGSSIVGVPLVLIDNRGERVIAAEPLLLVG